VVRDLEALGLERLLVELPEDVLLGEVLGAELDRRLRGRRGNRAGGESA
jgi:hypothetical protein